MKKIRNQKKLVLLVICFLILNIYSFNDIAAELEEEKNTTFSSGYISIESDQDFIDFSFPGSGTESNPYLIENIQIKSDSINSGIKITNTTKYFTIRNCSIQFGYHGIYIIDVAPGTAKIIENTGFTNIKNGIWIEATTEAYIARNNFSSNVICGIRLENCNESLIEENICIDNGGDGILLCNSYNLEISKNLIMDNIYYGIASKVGSGSTISYNYIENHVEFGVFLNVFSSDYCVHHNDFVGNLQGSADQQSQACNHGENNIWYDVDSDEGNYWEDWTGEGEYQIYGNEGCCDPYPLNAPVSGLAPEEPEEPEETNLLVIPGFMVLVGFIAVAVYIKRP
jgi:parallel beta-helix repeat protein